MITKAKDIIFDIRIKILQEKNLIYS